MTKEAKIYQHNGENIVSSIRDAGENEQLSIHLQLKK